MRKYNNNINGTQVFVEEFSTFNELLNTCDNRDINSWADDSARKRTDDRWCGGSYKEARELLLYGWDEKLDEIKKRYETFVKALDTQKPRPHLSVVGYAPCVPNAIKGVPKNMFNKHMEPKKTKVIDICVDLGVPSSVDADEVINKSIEVLAKINSLEMSGYRVKLSFLKTFNNKYDNFSYCCKMTLKNEFQPLDIKRVAFPLGHPAMFRRIMFDWYERFPNAKYISSYGYPICVLDRDYHSYYENLVKGLCSQNQYVINYYTDLNKMFEDLK